MTLKVGFDIDGVLYPWHRYVYNDMLEKKLVDYDYNFFWSTGVWKEEWYQELLSKYAKDPVFVQCNYLESYDPDIVEGVKVLSSLYDVYFITQRPEECALATFEWIENTFYPANIDYNNIYVCKDKVQTIDQITIWRGQLSYYVEDRIEYAERISELGIDTLLINQPYNINDSYRSKRFNSTVDAINHILYNREV